MTSIFPIIIGLILLVFFTAFFTVKQQTAAVIERFGKFSAIRQSGLRFKIPLIDRIAGKLSLKITNNKRPIIIGKIDVIADFL